MICPACTSPDCSEVAHINSLPAILFPAEPEASQHIATAPFHAASCATCGHVFATHVDAAFLERLYRDYYHLYPFDDLESLNAAYREPFERAFRHVAGAQSAPGKRLLEIGCSSARQLAAFAELGFDCTGISPGAQPDETIDMIDAFYEKHALDDSYDIVVSRFSLEHVIDLDRFMTKVSGDLAPGGRLIIQVPNASHFMDLGILNIFAHEHTHYFSASSLRALLARHGYDCLLAGSADAPSLVIAAEKSAMGYPDSRRFATLEASRAKTLQLIRSNAERRIIFYGAGLSLTGLLYSGDEHLKPTGDMHIVDDNTLLHGRQMPGFAVQIGPFQPELFDDAIAIITLSPIYHDRVLPKLRATSARALYVIDRSGNLIDERA